MRILIMAGGTGGHVFPALSLAKKMSDKGWSVRWLGTARGIESKLVPEAGYPLECLTVSGVRGRGLTHLLKAPFKIGASIVSSVRVLRAFKPLIVVGLGGYAAGPGGFAAWLCRIPLVIHEQNARPGTTNKLLRRFATKVLCGFPNTFPDSIYIGNPVRDELLAIDEPEHRPKSDGARLKVLVLGGSLGARALNSVVPKVLDELFRSGCKLSVCHQCGERNFDDTKAVYESLDIRQEIEAQHLKVTPFIKDMAKQMAWADLVICRSGALTVAELSVVGLASILVPFPYAIDDHQTANARWLADQGAALLMPEQELTQENLATTLRHYIDKPEKLVNMANNARRLARRDATERFSEVCLELANG